MSMQILNKAEFSKLSPNQKQTYLTELFQLPQSMQRDLAGPPIVIEGHTFDVSLQLMLQLTTPSDDKHNELGSVAENRAMMEAQSPMLSPPPINDILTDDFKMAVSDGCQITLRRYRHQNAASDNQPALVFYHGGGYVGGSLNTHDLVCQHLANDGKCTVIAVDYRRAPEYPHPVPVNDGLTAYRYIANHADKFGIDTSRLAVGGDSSGGNLAAIVAQQTKSESYAPKLQLLWVPKVDFSHERKSHTLFASGFFLETAKSRWYKQQYLGDGADDTKLLTDPMVSPIYGDLQGVAPAVVMVAGFDPLRDEGIEYADKLKAAGVNTTLHIYHSLPHLFLLFSGAIKEAKAAFDDAVQALKRL